VLYPGIDPVQQPVESASEQAREHSGRAAEPTTASE
jgi:hypothetical protein